MSIAAAPVQGPTRALAVESDEQVESRLCEIELSLDRYGCFDLVEADVDWLISTLRTELDRRIRD